MPLDEELKIIRDSELVTFVPVFVHSIQYPYLTPEGNQQLLLDVNDVKCILTVDVPNTVEKPFFDAFVSAYESAFGLQFLSALNTSEGKIDRDGFQTWLEEQNEENIEEENSPED